MDRAPLDVERLRQWCRKSRLWSGIEVCEAVDSTNSTLAARASAGAAEGGVLTAELQSAGRGRSDRSWTSPARAGIAVSMLLRPTVAAARWSWLPLLTGVAGCEAVAATTSVDVRLKWPNDILAGPRAAKLAGILAEVSGGAVVIGVGLNVSLRPDELPRPDATSLLLEGTAEPDRTALLIALLERTADWYNRWQEHEGDPRRSGLARAYRAISHTLGREVTVSMPGGATVLGRAADVDDDGRLCVDTVTGRIAVAAGDVHHVR